MGVYSLGELSESTLHILQSMVKFMESKVSDKIPNGDIFDQTDADAKRGDETLSIIRGFTSSEKGSMGHPRGIR